MITLVQCTESSTDLKEQQNGDYTLINDVEDIKLGRFDIPLPCCGCGIGWFCFLLGFVFPFMWYYATILYFGGYYHKDPRERPGLAANTVAASIFTIAALITVAALML